MEAVPRKMGASIPGLRLVFQYASVAVNPTSAAHILPGPRRVVEFSGAALLQEMLTLGVDLDAAELL